MELENWPASPRDSASSEQEAGNIGWSESENQSVMCRSGGGGGGGTTHGCRGCGPYCVAHCSCPEMTAVRQAMRLGWPLEDVLRLGRH